MRAFNRKISSVHWNGVHGKGEKNVETETQKDIKILAIESSCDETAASVVKNGRTILSNVLPRPATTLWLSSWARRPSSTRTAPGPTAM